MTDETTKSVASAAVRVLRKAEFRVDGMELVNVANERLHWSKTTGRNKANRHTAWSNTLLALNRRTFKLPLRVTIVRFGPKAMDSDGVARAAKHVRDGIADGLGVNDGDPLIDWQYRGPPGGYGIHVTIEELAQAPTIAEPLPPPPPPMPAALRALHSGRSSRPRVRGR